MSKVSIAFTVNGRPQQLDVEPHWTLLEAIREQLQLTGSKEGCGTGDCGACSMIVDGKVITSCCMLAAQADGSEVTTIEGLAKNGNLHPIQRAFIDEGGVQCGFCTPGMLLASKALLEHNPNPTIDDVREGLAGNLCRCTGYAKIYQAVLTAAESAR